MKPMIFLPESEQLWQQNLLKEHHRKIIDESIKGNALWENLENFEDMILEDINDKNSRPKAEIVKRGKSSY